MLALVLKVAVNAVALWIATLVVDGITLTGPNKILTLVVVALIFGVVNAVLKPIIKTVGCAFYVFTLGLIALVVNGLLFLLTGWIADQLGLPFAVDNVLSAILGALVVGIISWAINLAIPDKD